MEARSTSPPPSGTKFSSDLWDGFPLVARKTECGLQSCKDILQFYRKRAQIEEEYSKALVKLCISATSEKRMIFKGRGSSAIIAESPSILHGWETVIASTERIAKVHGECAKKINEQCAEPVASFIKDMEKQREATVQQGNKATKEYEDAIAAVEKAKQSYHRASTEFEAAESEKAKDAKAATKASQAAEKVKMTEFDYREKIQHHNTVQEKYLKESMPKALDDLQHWESVRSHLIKTNIKKFTFCLERIPESWKDTKDFIAKGVEVIDSVADIDRFVEENKTYNVPPPPLEFEAYVPGNLPTDKKRFTLGDFGSKLGNLATKASSLTGNALSSAANLAAGGKESFSFITKEEKKEGVFEVPLEEIMALQKDQTELEVPKVLVSLTEAIVNMGGCRTEGIFRVPASATEVQNLKKQVNSGKYDVEMQTNDVNVPAALLKLWLRTLPDPLVPTPLYDPALASTGPEGAVAVFNKLPPLNSKVVRHLVKFLALMAEPETSKVTFMTLENLSMVFAPSLLRCPTEDPMVILSNAKKECTFMKNLILGLHPHLATAGSGSGVSTLDTALPPIRPARTATRQPSGEDAGQQEPVSEIEKGFDDLAASL